MPTTREIPRPHWESYLQEVTDAEVNHLVRLERDTLAGGSEQLLSGVPLAGLSLEGKGEFAEAVDITFAPGTPAGDYMHHIDHTRSIYAVEDDDGRLQCLDIEGDDGKTLVYFD